MRFSALLAAGAVAAALAAGCGGDKSNEEPAADSLGIDSNMISAPLDTTSVLDSTNAPVKPDSLVVHDTAKTPAVKSDTVGTDTRGTSTSGSTPSSDTTTGAGAVSSGVRRGAESGTSAGAGTRRTTDGATASGRRR
jgi:hypothetical protein